MDSHRCARPYVTSLLLLLLSGCATGTTMTLVEGGLEPRHFQFTTVVPKRGKGPGGWRAACIHVALRRNTGDSFVCKMGIEVPIESKDGPVSVPLAQRIAADCANRAAHVAFEPTTPATPLGLACESFKTTYHAILYGVIAGSRVKTLCHEKAKPVEIGP